MKGFIPLASGSKGNCLYYSSGKTKLLIDAGLSARAICQRLELINVDISEIQAIVITHEHTDHIQGLKVLALKYGIRVFANAETAKGIVEAIKGCPKFTIFSTGESFQFGDVELHPFSIQHDTLDPVAFTLSSGGVKVGICTDLGFVTTLVSHHLQGCDYIVLEANHDPHMVKESSRPHVYKQRVLGRMGHLSNQECGNLLHTVHHPKLKHVHLAHLSSECNTHALALGTVEKHLATYQIKVPLSIAYQEHPSFAIHFDKFEAQRASLTLQQSPQGEEQLALASSTL